MTSKTQATNTDIGSTNQQAASNLAGRNVSPWNVESSDDFLFYCCPEYLCHFKCKSKQGLIDHAIVNHETARDFCENFKHELSVESKNEKNESTILELIACQTYENKETVTDDLDPEGHQPINIGSLNDKQSVALMGVNKKLFNFLYRLTEKHLKVCINFIHTFISPP